MKQQYKKNHNIKLQGMKMLDNLVQMLILL